MNKPNILVEDFKVLKERAMARGYMLTFDDVFAIGWMCGKYDVKELLNNKEALAKACEEYDKTDPLQLFDTIKEVFMDLDILPVE